jgi:hypothetical protein
MSVFGFFRKLLGEPSALFPLGLRGIIGPPGRGEVSAFFRSRRGVVFRREWDCNVDDVESGLVDERPGANFAPDDLVIGFGHGCVDEHAARLGHVALFRHHIGVVAVGRLHVGVEPHGTLIPFAGFGEILFFVVGVGGKQGGGVVRGLRLESLGIALQRLAEVAASKRRLACTHGLFHDWIIRELDRAVRRQFLEKLAQVFRERTGIPQSPSFLEKVPGPKTLLACSVGVSQSRRMFDKRRRQRDEHFAVLGIILG